MILSKNKHFRVYVASYINVVIANILLYRKSLYDLSRRKCKIANNRSGRGQKGRGSEKCPTGDDVYASNFCYLGPREEIYVEKSRGSSDVSGIITRYRIIMDFQTNNSSHLFDMA